MTNDDEVHNRVIQTSIVAYEMGETPKQVNQMMVDAINLAHLSVQGKQHEDAVLSGATNLMDFQELRDVNKHHLFKAFSQKKTSSTC